jgi:hypothetical protein
MQIRSLDIQQLGSLLQIRNQSVLNLVSGNATKHIVGDNIIATKHYVGSTVRFDTLFCRDIESFLLF